MNVASTVAGATPVPLAEALELAVVGGKARPLALALDAGHRVPAGFVVPVGTSSSALSELVATGLRDLGEGPFAVRSSAVGEDGAAHSFAGQLETLLNVPAKRVVEAVKRCLASAGALRALRYGRPLGGVAVIVQRMVPAEAAGVAFSADPRSGARDVVVLESVASLGEALVSGAVSPEAWRVDGETAVRERAPAGHVLSEAQAREVAALARGMEALFGAPQDVEWAFHEGALHLLQSRPITALPAAPIPIDDSVPDGGWDRDDHHGVLSPLGWHWFQAYPPALAATFRAVGAPIAGAECTRVGGHLYMRMVMEGPDGPPPPKWVLWLASRLAPSMRKANRVAAELFDGETYMNTVDAWYGGERDAFREELRAIDVADPSELDDAALLERIERAFAFSAKGLAKHAELHGPPSAALAKLFMFGEDELGWGPEDALAIVAGSSHATTGLHAELSAIVARHRDGIEAAETMPTTWAALMHDLPALGEELAAWLADNRLRMMHYGPRHPTLGERPQYVLSIVESILHEASASPLGADRHVALLEEACGRLDEPRAAELRRLADVARRAYPLREDNGRETVSMPAGLLRHFVLELGRRLDGVPAAHAVYLTPDEHGPALRGELDDLVARIERRRGEESWALRNRGPRRLGPPEPPPPPHDAFPRGMQMLMRMVGFIMATSAAPEPVAGEGLRGVGIGTRVVTAPARVVERPADMVHVRHGEVVVCRITSPEWAVGLGRVAALVTDEGGLLSHPAIIAREFDVSAVVGADGATAAIRTGDTVQVDPVEGTVAVVASAGAPR